MIDPAAISKVVAHALLGSSDDRDCQWLHLEWAIDYFVGHDAVMKFPEAMQCYRTLAKEDHTVDNPFVFNDLDNAAFIVEWPGDWVAYAMSDQNVNYVYVLKEVEAERDLNAELEELLRDFNRKRQMRVYEYWNVKPGDPEECYKPHYSDCPDGEFGYGPDRPTLEWLIEHDGTKYNDCRDKAWIVRTPSLAGKDGHTVWKLTDIRHALWNIEQLHTVLQIEITDHDEHKSD